MDDTLDRWYDNKRFPPLSVYYGGRDFLVRAEPLLERLAREGVEVMRVVKLDLSEVGVGVLARQVVNSATLMAWVEWTALRFLLGSRRCVSFQCSLQRSTGLRIIRVAVEWVYSSLRGESLFGDLFT